MMRRRAGGEDGFTMLMTLGILVICAALSAVAFGAVNQDLPLRKESREKKGAYAAAEAGLNFYLSRLNQDNEYWARCTSGPPPNATEFNPVNQRWDGAGTDPRKWRVVPGETAQYTVELLPVAPATQCLTTDPAGTMLDPATGTMRIRATGQAGNEKRSIIATLRRKNFLDYVYFTDYETTDPVLYGTYASWAEANCKRYRASRNPSCLEIQFAANDTINGPFHTNDDILTCNGATFGRSAADRLEASGPAPGWKNVCGTSAPNFKSTWQAGVPQLPIPTSNATITSVAVAPYILTGTQRLIINDTTMTIKKQGVSDSTIPLPANGVIWVKNGSGCGAGVSPALQNYDEPAGCANVRVSGRYAKSLTLVSDKDIIVDGNLTRASDDNLLGLIATNFVRVYHPVDRNVSPCVNRAGSQTNVDIEAAILSLQHSFIVDNYNCGAQLGTLSVEGAIAQRFRGAVGTNGGTGYLKNYIYDDRMKYRNPPFFLEPVSAAWRLLRTNEQVPAR